MFKNVIELESNSEVVDLPFWKLPKEEQTAVKVCVNHPSTS